MKIFQLALLFIFYSIGCSAQLKEFSSYYKRSDKEDSIWKLRKHPIKVHQFQELYINDKLVFEPMGDSSARYEILNDKYVFISFFDTSYRNQSIGFTLWSKGRVFIISIKNPKMQYHVDIGGQCRSQGVIEFFEDRKLLRIKHKKTNEIIDIVVFQK